MVLQVNPICLGLPNPASAKLAFPNLSGDGKEVSKQKTCPPDTQSPKVPKPKVPQSLKPKVSRSLNPEPRALKSQPILSHEPRLF